jgi:hypothetical protein
MGTKFVLFLAIILTALMVVPGGAHLFAMPNKTGMSQGEYFVAQSIYRSWSLFGIVFFAALALNILAAVLLWDQGTPFWLAAVAAVLIAINLIIFFVWTYPANQATNNWVTVPANWEALRAQWEYSHAVNAFVSFAALCSVTWAALLVRD